MEMNVAREVAALQRMTSCPSIPSPCAAPRGETRGSHADPSAPRRHHPRGRPGRRRPPEGSAEPEGGCAMLTEEQAWVLVGLGFLSALALYVEQGTWAGLFVPVFLIVVFSIANPGGPGEGDH